MARTFTRLPPALDRALPLLAPWAREEGRLRPEGYLDLVGEAAPESTGMTQDLMVSRIVPAIYERWWRPALGRVAKGVLGPGMQDEHRIARLLLGLSPGDGVLDVACGTGNFTRDFARTVGPDGLAVGIDVSETMLARAVEDTEAAELLDRTAYVRGDAAELPFIDSSFDAVCCFAALHLFADPLRALDRMTDVLTPGGRIAIFTSSQGRTPLTRPVIALSGRRSGMRVFEQGEVVRALEKRGYREIQQRITGVTQFVGGRLAA
ncbi:MAG TPA: methyltransferase domain-containing protein [Thermoleophilaceae bacterium]